MWQYNYSDELYHHGILGMKWGIRRYQNKDGSLTPAGKKRYDKDVALWGQKGADRIANRMKEGDTHKKAVKKEVSRDLAIGIGVGLGLTITGAAVSKYSSKGMAAMKPYKNVSILDSNGQVLKSYKNKDAVKEIFRSITKRNQGSIV
jgi:hypothetical protein